MSVKMIEPGQKLWKNLVNPETGQVILPVGTVLTQGHIERLIKNGLAQHLSACVEAPGTVLIGEDEEQLPEPAPDLEAFDIEIPALPDFIESLVPELAESGAQRGHAASGWASASGEARTGAEPPAGRPAGQPPQGGHPASVVDYHAPQASGQPQPVLDYRPPAQPPAPPQPAVDYVPPRAAPAQPQSAVEYTAPHGAPARPQSAVEYTTPAAPPPPRAVEYLPPQAPAARPQPAVDYAPQQPPRPQPVEQRAPQQAAYPAPPAQGGGYPPPQQPAYAPQQPSYAPPPRPAYAEPPRPAAYGGDSGAYGQPAPHQPGYGQSQPGYGQPQPGYAQPPAQPPGGYGQPSYAPPAPSYMTPPQQTAYMGPPPTYAPPPADPYGYGQAAPYPSAQPSYGAPAYPAGGYGNQGYPGAGHFPAVPSYMAPPTGFDGNPLPPVYPSVPAAPDDTPGTLMGTRYHHNPSHLLPQRVVRAAMVCAEFMDDQIRKSRVPAYEPIRDVVDQILDCLGTNAQKLNHGVEVRVVGQPPQRCHALNVMMLSLVMGLALNYNHRELWTLALGAFCHDIGKTAIPPEVLNKVGPLSPHDIELLRSHPVMGQRIVKNLPWGSPLIATIVHQHHERNDGSGYPMRLVDHQIFDMAKIVAVAEVYDSLLLPMPYRPAVSPEAAYHMIMNYERTKLDPGMVQAFRRYVVPYPLHSFVRLNTNEVGQVLYVSPENVLQPVVRVGHEDVDLARQNHRKIVAAHVQPF